MYQRNVFHFARVFACAASAAMLFALPPAGANDRDDDRGRGRSHHHHDSHDRDDLRELASELRELKARVRRLEGHLTRDEVAGSYVFRSIQASLLSTNPPQVGRLEHLASVGTLQLNANGSFSYSGRETGFNAIWTVPTNRERVDRADSASGTWTYLDGVLYLTIDGSGEVVPFGGAVGGRMFLYAGSNPADGSRTLVLLVRNN